MIAHRLADPDAVVTRAGTIRRPERSHQLDTTGVTGMGSLRLQDGYRVDPNDLRSLPAGVAYVVSCGRAAKVAVAAARATTGPGSGLPGGGQPPSSCLPDSDHPRSVDEENVVASDQGEAEPVARSGQDAGSDADTLPPDSNHVMKSASPYAQGL